MLSDDDLTSELSIKSILKFEKSFNTEKRVLPKRSLLHSFERPRRNIDNFVENALGSSGKLYEIEAKEKKSERFVLMPKIEKTERKLQPNSHKEITRSRSLDRNK